MDRHLPKDLKTFRAVAEKGAPFFNTACGQAVTPYQITDNPSLSNCHPCVQAYTLSNRSHQGEPDLGLENGPDLGFDDDLSDFDGASDLDGESPAEFEVSPVDSGVPDHGGPSAGSPGPLGDFGPMLDMVLSGYDPPEDLDPDAWLEAQRGGLLLRPDELDFLSSLVSISKLIGVGGLSIRVVAVLDSIESRLVKTQKAALDSSEAEEE